MKKKILSLILVAAMLASMLVFAPATGATETEAKATWEVTDSAGFAGDTVSVDVVISMHVAGQQKCSALHGVFSFDETRLELVSRVRAEEFYEGGMNAGGADESDMFAEFTKDGSHYSVYAGAGTVDPAIDYAAFTLTFKIKDDAPAGEAYVAFDYRAPLASNVSYDGQNFYDQPGDIEYISGRVTVLPDGYNNAPSTEGMTFTNNTDGTATFDYYEGEATELVIPEFWYDADTDEILTVTKVSPMVFCSIEDRSEGTNYKLSTDKVKGNETVTKIVVPATVQTIADYAFMNGEAVEEIIILGAPTIGMLALGTIGGAWKSTNRAWNAEEYVDVIPKAAESEIDAKQDVVSSVVLKAPDVSIFDAYIADVVATTTEVFVEDGLWFTYNAMAYAASSATLTLNIGAIIETYFVYGVDAIVAPTFDGVVAWKDAEGNVYAPGADIGDVTELTAVVVEAPVTNKGVTAKITNEFAMRFQATISKATYDAMAELGEVTMGMLITPRQYVVKAGNVFTMEALDALVAGKGFAGYVRVDVQNPYSANAGTFEECTEFTIAGSISGLKDSTAAQDPDFVSVGFLQVTLESGAVVTVYSDYNYLYANKVSTFLDTVDTDGLGTTELGWINAWKKKYPAIFPDVE